MVNYHQIELTTKKITIMKTYHRKNLTPSSTSNTIDIIDRANYITIMQKLLPDTKKVVKAMFNPKHKVNNEIRHLLDIELSIVIYLTTIIFLKKI